MKFTEFAAEFLEVLFAATARDDATVDAVTDGAVTAVCALVLPLKAPDASWETLKSRLLSKMGTAFDIALKAHLSENAEGADLSTKADGKEAA